MKRSRICLQLGVAAVVLLLSVLSTQAGVMKIWMDEFKSDFLPLHGETTTLIYMQNPSGVIVIPFISKTSWTGWAPVNLPVGTTIQNVSYYHGGNGHFASCTLFRIKFGKASEVIADASSTATNATLVPLNVPDASKLMIMAGYRYYVQVFTATSAMVRGVKITY